MDNRLLGKLFSEYAQALYRVALSRTGDIELSKDIVSQAFVLLYEKQPEFKCRDQLKVWLIRAVCKLSASEKRKFEYTRTVPLCRADDLTQNQPLLVEFYDLLSCLPQTLRDVTVLFYIEDMKVSDISKALGISKCAVKTRLSRARKKLKDLYEEEIL